MVMPGIDSTIGAVRGHRRQLPSARLPYQYKPKTFQRSSWVIVRTCSWMSWALGN